MPASGPFIEFKEGEDFVRTSGVYLKASEDDEVVVALEKKSPSSFVVTELPQVQDDYFDHETDQPEQEKIPVTQEAPVNQETPVNQEAPVNQEIIESTLAQIPQKSPPEQPALKAHEEKIEKIDTSELVTIELTERRHTRTPRALIDNKIIKPTDEAVIDQMVQSIGSIKRTKSSRFNCVGKTLKTCCEKLLSCITCCVRSQKRKNG